MPAEKKNATHMTDLRIAQLEGRFADLTGTLTRARVPGSDGAWIPLFPELIGDGGGVVSDCCCFIRVSDVFGGTLIENTTKKPITKTVTICNDDTSFAMSVTVGDDEVAEIEAGRSKTIVVEVPAGKSLDIDRPGRYQCP